MDWREVVYNRLNYRQGQSKIIQDQTGILIHDTFQEYLRSHFVTETLIIASSLSDILLHSKEAGKLIISPNISLPSYLDGKIDVMCFDYQKLPVDIDFNAAKTLKVDELICLISYLLDSENSFFVTSTNISQSLEAAKKHEKETNIKKLEDVLRKAVQDINDYNDILLLGNKWGEYIYNCFEAGAIPYFELTNQLDSIVEDFVLKGELKKSFYEPASNLKTVDKIRSYINSTSASKIAVVCFDCMGGAEWQLLKRLLNGAGFNCLEKYVFALVPTITRISRSSIYYGDYQSVYSLSSPNEQKQLEEYFKERTCRFYSEGDIQSEDNVLGVDVVSVIYNVFDEIAHDTNLPPGETTKELYFENVRNYFEKSQIINELLLLKDLGYSIFLCSDHGCVVGKGNGQKIDKYLIEASSKRATLISKSDLSQFYDVNHYEIPFLQDNKVALLAKGRTIFASDKVVEISHGGITLDELVVPFVEVIN